MPYFEMIRNVLFAFKSYYGIFLKEGQEFMETFGKRWQLRLLAGLLAIFVTLYFMTDLFGGVRADDGSPTPGESSEVDEDTVDEEEPSEDEEAEEEDADNGVMPLAEDEDEKENVYYPMLEPPFKITSVTATINGATLQPGGTAAVKDDDEFTLDFKWEISDKETHSFETFYYDLSNDLKGIKLKDTTPPGIGIDYTGDGVNDAYYVVENNVLMLVIRDTKTYSGYKGGFKVSGTVDLSESGEDDDGKFDIHFADKTYYLVDAGKVTSLKVSKERDGEAAFENGEYWQKFTVTVTNPSDNTSAENVQLIDQYGNLFTGEIRNLTINGTPSNKSVTGANSEFSLPLENIPANDSVTVTYEMKLDPQNMLNDGGNTNSATSTATNITHSTTDWANASYDAPSFQKSGTLSADGKTITWTIKVKPGFLKDTEWSVTDRGETWPKNDGEWIQEGDFYTRTFETDAPDPDPYVNTTETNTATFTADDLSKDFSGSVPIPAKDTTDYINKTHGAVTTNGSTVLVPYAIRVHIPDKDVANITIRDVMDDNHSLGQDPNRIRILYDNTFKITDEAGNTYEQKTPQSDWHIADLNGVGSIYAADGGASVSFELQINDPTFLAQHREQDITIHYMLQIQDPTISTVKNKVTMNLTFKDYTHLPEQKDSDTYQRRVLVTKEVDWYGPYWQYKRHPRSWKVTVTNNSSNSVSGSITITDTLPGGYLLCKKDSGECELRVTDPDGNEVPYTITGENSSQFTVTIAKAYSNKKILYLYYTAQMTEAEYNKVSATQQTAYSYTNKVEATLPGVGSGMADDVFKVDTSNSPLLSKSDFTEKTGNIVDGVFTANCRIEVNENAELLGSNQIKVVDTLGDSLTLAVDTVKVYKFSGNTSTEVTNSVTVSYDENARRLSIGGLEDNTRYRIEYNVTGTALYANELTDTNAPGVTAELDRRFGNSAELYAGDKSKMRSEIRLNDSSYRQSAYFTFQLSIDGEKLWDGIPAGTTQPTEATFRLQRTETKITGNVETSTYTFKLKQDGVEYVSHTNNGFQPSITRTHGAWTFSVADLTLRDSPTGTTYTYQLSEETIDGYQVNYQYKTQPNDEWKPVVDPSVGVNSGAILQENKSGSIYVQVTNTHKNAPVVSKVTIQKNGRNDEASPGRGDQDHGEKRHFSPDRYRGGHRRGGRFRSV